MQTVYKAFHGRSLSVEVSELQPGFFEAKTRLQANDGHSTDAGGRDCASQNPNDRTIRADGPTAAAALAGVAAQLEKMIR
jgi:hypothetical protein